MGFVSALVYVYKHYQILQKCLTFIHLWFQPQWELLWRLEEPNSIICISIFIILFLSLDDQMERISALIPNQPVDIVHIILNLEFLIKEKVNILLLNFDCYCQFLIILTKFWGNVVLLKTSQCVFIFIITLITSCGFSIWLKTYVFSFYWNTLNDSPLSSH